MQTYFNPPVQVRAVEERLKAKERVSTCLQHMMCCMCQSANIMCTVIVWQENWDLQRANGRLSADYCQLLARYVVGRAATVQLRTDQKKTKAR